MNNLIEKISICPLLLEDEECVAKGDSRKDSCSANYGGCKSYREYFSESEKDWNKFVNSK